MSDFPSASPQLRTLLISDLVDSTAMLERIGDQLAAELFARHDRMARDLMRVHGAREIDRTDGFLLLFERPISAVEYALAYHDHLDALGREMTVPLQARVGIHVGEVILRTNDAADIARGAKPVEVEGLAKPMVARMMSLALPRQTLLTRTAFDLARRAAIRIDEGDSEGRLQWLAHGRYQLKGVIDPVEVYEVGREGVAPLAAPRETDKIHRVVDHDTITGWRPAPGVEMPLRPNWILQQKIGMGGFGDVWLAEHRKTGDKRVFKFCYDAHRLTGLKREVTLVRLLKEELGERRDIARILDWNFDEQPYFLEAEYSSAGSLDAWVDHAGGVSAVPLETRVEVVAQVAEALAAAHSVGVLHKDVKPGNILIAVDPDGHPRAQLADFGIGLLTDRERLDRAGITAVSFTEVEGLTDLSATGAGTRLYLAPELLEGKPATVHADAYALGVVLYQLVIGDLTRSVSPGWERDVEDPILRQDIASAVEGHPERRIEVRHLAECLRRLGERREERSRRRAEEARAVRARRRRRWAALVGGGLVLVLLATGLQLRRVALEGQRANREAEKARQVSRFLVDLFRLADPSEARGNSVTAREILDEGARRIPEELAEQPVVQADLMTTMGHVYNGLGLPRSAVPVLEQAAAIRRRELGPDSPELAAALVLLGDARLQAGAYDSAVAVLETALAIREARFGPRDTTVGEVLLVLAETQRRMARYEEALSSAQRSVDIYRAAGVREALASGLSRLGNVLFTIQRFSEAEASFREALTLARSLYGEENRLVSQMMNNLGVALTAQDRLAEAAEFASDALRINRALNGNQHWEVGASAWALALLLLQQGDYAGAERLSRESLQIFDAVYGPENQFTLGALANLAWVLTDQGRCGEAEPLARKAMEGFLATVPPGHWSVAQAKSVLGECLMTRGRLAEAEPMLVDGYETLRTTQGGLWARAALERVIRYYERSGNRERANAFRQQRAG